MRGLASRASDSWEIVFLRSAMAALSPCSSRLKLWRRKLAVLALWPLPWPWPFWALVLFASTSTAPLSTVAEVAGAVAAAAAGAAPAGAAPAPAPAVVTGAVLGSTDTKLERTLDSGRSEAAWCGPGWWPLGERPRESGEGECGCECECESCWGVPCSNMARSERMLLRRRDMAVVVASRALDQHRS